MRPSGGDRNGTGTGLGDDAALLRAVARGDSEALATLYDRHAGWLHARLARRCADPETVREVLQDTFVTVWRSAGTHRGGETGGWLWVIAARRLVDAQRARTRAERAEYAGFAPAGAAQSAEERVLAGLEYGDVGTALDRISPELREVLRATVVDGLTTRETARLLGLPEGTVKTRAMRARRELRRALAELGALDGPNGPHALDGLTRGSEPLGGTA
ncbi:RNA polymerase sigma factor [Streptomyces altiplanensis]